MVDDESREHQPNSLIDDARQRTVPDICVQSTVI